MAEIIRGSDVAAAIKEEIKQTLSDKNIIPQLATVRVGERADDVAYERSLTKNLSNLGLEVKNIVLAESTSEAELISVINEVNEDDKIHGILLFRPLPKHINSEKIVRLISDKKDIDCMNPINMAKLAMSDKSGYAPCTAQAVMEVLDYLKLDLRGKRAVVIGRSLVVGKPLGLMLLDRDATVTWCHSKTKDIAAMCKDADIIVVAVGRPYFLKAEHVEQAAKDCVVVDVGINAKPDGEPGICGDAAFDEVAAHAGYITPVPGGVGSVTTAVLAKQLLKAALNA